MIGQVSDFVHSFQKNSVCGCYNDRKVLVFCYNF